MTEEDMLKSLVALWVKYPIARGIAAEWARRSECDAASYFRLLFKDVLPYVDDKATFFNDTLLLSFLVPYEAKEILLGLAEACEEIHEDTDLGLLAHEVCEFNQRFWRVEKDWILEAISKENVLGRHLRRQEGPSGAGFSQSLREDIQAFRAALSGEDLWRRMGAPADDELAPQFLTDVFAHTHLLRYYSRDKGLRAVKPFAAKDVLIVLHFLRDLIPFIKATIELGLDPANAVLFYKQYPYPQRKAVGEWLRDHRCKVLPISQMEPYLRELDQASAEQIGQILVIEDGGFCVPMLHRCFPNLLKHTVGAVEQTTRGIMNAEDWMKEKPTNKLAIPVLSVAGSKLKADFEPNHIAKAVVGNIGRMLPNMAWNGKEIGIFGFGTIGQEIANWVMANGANVTVYEPAGGKQIVAQQRGGIRVADTASEAASSKHIVIGTSGRQSINADAISRVSHNTYLISASSEQYEIDQDELARLALNVEPLYGEIGNVIGTDFLLAPDGRRIHLLANGYPVNFWGMESMPEEDSDLILTIILLAAAEVAKGGCARPGIDTDAVNVLADDQHYAIAKKFIQMHKAR